MRDAPDLSGELACPKCRGPLLARQTAVVCAGCAAEYSVQEDVLCTDRADVFMGEFDRDRMREFTRTARKRGWRQTAQEEMAVEHPGILKILLSPERAAFRAFLAPPDGESVLDLGAGMGAVSLQLAGSFERVYAIDQSFERLAFLQVVADQERAGTIRTICHRDVFHLPFASGTLSAAVMVGVIEYFPLSYPELKVREVQLRALRELYRVLAPDGVLFIATKNRFGWPYWAGAKDNSGLRFGALLPRTLADLASRLLLHRPYRVITDSYWGYATLLRQSGFAELGFHWPVGGYQTPQSWVDLSDQAAVRQQAKAYAGGSLKRAALSTLHAVGGLKFVVPHLGIIARKPRSQAAA